MAPLEVESYDAAWKLAATGDSAHEEAVTKSEAAIKRYLADPEAFAALTRARGETNDGDTARQLQLAWLSHAGNQTDPALLERLVGLEASAETTYARFRPEIDGRPVSENEIRQLLRDEDDVARRRTAWEASKALGPIVAPSILEMVKLRNEAAAARGHRSYWESELELQEIDRDFLLNTFERLIELSDDAYDALLDQLFSRIESRFGVARADIRPWHLADPFFQEMPAPPGLSLSRFYEKADLVELTRAFCERLGFDVASTLERSDLFPRDGKNQHAFCAHVNRMSDDVRVLCNVTPDEYWMDTMLHEFGHAVYDLGFASELPWLLRAPAHTLSTEAIALLFGRFAYHPAFLTGDVGADAGEVEKVSAAAWEFQRSKQLVFPRWVMVMMHFERELYANPDQDLNSVWWDLVEKYQKIPRPEGREGGADWACKVHVALAPVYYHNYLLGDLMASQLDAYLRREVGTDLWFREAKAGSLLQDGLFAEGARRPWNEALQHLTGEELDPRYYVEQFVTG